ncbi:MAG: hypothetical protein AAF845_02665 [Bacteroidota bacterium]
MRTLLLGAAAFFLAASASAQDAPAPDPSSTYVHPAHAGEALRVTTYDQRPTERGRLAARYVGLRANRSAKAAPRLVTGLQPAERTFDTPRHTYVRRGGSYFQVVPAQ